jgi:hypothetical protein
MITNMDKKIKNKKSAVQSNGIHNFLFELNSLLNENLCGLFLGQEPWPNVPAVPPSFMP